jgi:nicotinamide mononucleotide adenylyltransferase
MGQDCVELILQQWQGLVVGVVDATIPRPHQIPQEIIHFCGLADEKNRPERNPFSPKERVEMWQQTLQAFGLSKNVVVVPLKRPEYDLEWFAQEFPAINYDLVFPTLENETASFDAVRNQTFEKIFRGRVFFVKPRFVLHGSTVRQLIEEGKDWSEFIPRGALEVFLRIQGPERMQTVVALDR